MYSRKLPDLLKYSCSQSSPGIGYPAQWPDIMLSSSHTVSGQYDAIKMTQTVGNWLFLPCPFFSISLGFFQFF